MRRPFAIAAAFMLFACLVGNAADPTILSRHIGVRDYCAWPNITKLPDGTLAAVIYNKPTHGRTEGDVECWVSKDGKEWTKAGTPIPHEGQGNRMNVGCGLNRRGELVVLSSGWTLKPNDDPTSRKTYGHVLRTASGISADNGKTWKTNPNSFPAKPDSYSDYVPFGDIFVADDGSLRTVGYATHFKTKRDDVWMMRSTDDGATWTVHAPLAENHNETALFHLGKGHWLAAARKTDDGKPTDLFRSDDDGKTWTMATEKIGAAAQHPADLLRLADGRLLLTLGVRETGKNGVGIRLSEDNGKTWGPLMAIVNDCKTSDCGYPSSEQLADGSIVTGFYAKGSPQYDGYQFATVIWKVPAAK